MAKAYWRIVWRRAVVETKTALSLSRGFVIRTALVSLVGVGLSWRFRPLDATMNTGWAVLIGVILANVVVTIGVFLFQFFRVPALVHEDQQAELAVLAPQKRRREVADRLAERSEQVVNSFWARKPTGDNETEIAEWIEGVDRWHAETLEIMERRGCTASEIISVRTLGNLAEFASPSGYRYHSNGRVNQRLLMIEGYRRRLQTIIDRYANS